MLIAMSWGGIRAVPASGAGNDAVEVAITHELEPARLEIAPGTTVTWTNEDEARHRIRSREGPVRFDSGNLEPGASFSFTFVAEGTYAYRDERDKENPGYSGTITVAAGVAPASEGPGSRSDAGDSAGGSGTDDRPPTSGTVSILDRSFSPASVSLAVGGTVTWTNTSDRDHTVTFREGADGSDVMAPGVSFENTFPSAGTFGYFCAIHPEMTGTVTVTDASDADTPDGPAQPAPETPGSTEATSAGMSESPQRSPQPTTSLAGTDTSSSGGNDGSTAGVGTNESVADAGEGPRNDASLLRWPLVALSGAVVVAGVVAAVRRRREQVGQAPQTRADRI